MEKREKKKMEEPKKYSITLDMCATCNNRSFLILWFVTIFLDFGRLKENLFFTRVYSILARRLILL